MKEEHQKIKDEPSDDFDLFENFDTILVENPEGSEEANLSGIFKHSKKELTSESSESESEYEFEAREQKRRSRMLRGASEFRDFDLK